MHPVHARASANHLLLGQVAAGEGSDEIAAIPELLKMREIAGAIGTIDAMGCREEVARAIRVRKADYLLALEGNREPPPEQVVASRDGACARGRKEGGIRDHRGWSRGHGRDECRRCRATSEIDRRAGRRGWADPRSAVLIEHERLIGDSPTVEERCYLGSLPADAKLLNESARGPGSVGSSLHRVLDVASHEDAGRIGEGNAPEDFGLLRRPALCLLKEGASSTRGIRGKRRRASRDDDDRLRVICGNAGNC